MIPGLASFTAEKICKPRASGDDPFNALSDEQFWL